MCGLGADTFARLQFIHAKMAREEVALIFAKRREKDENVGVGKDTNC